MTQIMIIRHAEKPTEDGAIRGVAEHGLHDRHALSVRGWQRAGALVRFFAPRERADTAEHIVTPRAIFASAQTLENPSARSRQTVAALADELGVTITSEHTKGDEAALAAAVLEQPGPVLVVWHHKQIPRLARAITGEEIDCPPHWPAERFDLVWVLEQGADGRWALHQIPQRLLPNDGEGGI
jgi:hypothetical protein